jgi:protein O-mannosyl-transferase
VNRCRKRDNLPEDRTRQRRQAEASSKTIDSGAPGVRTTWAVCIFLVLAVAAVFGQTVNHGFINHDDALYVVANLHVTQDPPAQGVLWALTSTKAANWHPLTWFSHILDYRIYGLWAGGHHLTSVLLHAATAVLLFFVLRQMTGDFWPSAFVAAVFAVHPLRVESVAWVAERKDVLSGLFFVLTLWAYLGYVRRPFSWVRYLTAVVLFALGLMSKPMLVTLPFVLLLLDYWPLRRFSGALSCSDDSDGHCRATAKTTEPSLTQRGLPPAALRRVLVEKIPFLALAAASCVVTTLVQREAMTGLTNIPLASRFANAAVSCVAYLGQFFFPVGLTLCYPHPGASLPAWKGIAALLILTLITLGVLVRWRREPYLPVGWFWYLGMLVPVIGLVQVGEQAMADRYTYLPQIGLCMALAWGAAYWTKSWSYGHVLCGVTSALAITVLLGCACHQTSLWRNDETLWGHALACNDRNHVAHFNVGEALRNRGQIDEAIKHFQAALDILPRSELFHNNLGIALADRGKTEEAVKHFRAALDFDRNYVEAHCNLGATLLTAGRAEEAMTCFENALRIKPGFAEAHSNLGTALAMQGRKREAIGQLREAVNIKHDFANAHYNLAILLADQGQTEEAITHCRRALELARQQNQGALAESVEANLRLYEARIHSR